MAAVIRYLSADNHTADTPPLNSIETGRQSVIMSLLRGAELKRVSGQCPFYISVICSMITVYVPECVSMCAHVL